jgi:hypothetical protein
LWQVDDLSHPKLPQGFPNLIPFHLIWGNDATKSINKFFLSMTGFLNIWSFKSLLGCARMKPIRIKLGPYMDYWENIFELLLNPLPTQNSTHLEGF